MRKAAKNVLYTVLGAALFVAVWHIAAAAYGKPFVFPSPADTAVQLLNELGRAIFWRGFLYSVLRSFIAFVCACLLAVIFAFLGKAFAPVKKILAPVVGILRSLPTMSIILLLVLWTDGAATPVIISGLVIFPVLYSAIDSALYGVGCELEETARLYADNAAYKFFKIYLPMAAPPFLSVAGGAVSLSLKLTVAAEVMAQTRNSLGMLMQQASVYFEIGRLMALTVAVVIAAFVMELAVYLLRRMVDYR